MRSRPCLQFVALAVVISISTAAAQERLFTFIPGTTAAPAVLAEIGSAPGELGVLKAVLRPAVGFEVTSAAPVARGRFIAVTRYLRNNFPGTTELHVLDLRSRAVIDTGVRFMPGVIVASDPRSPRVVVRHLTLGGRYGFSTVNLERIVVSELGYTIPGESLVGETLFAYTVAGPRLIVGTTDGVDVVDIATGQLARTVAGSGSALAADHLGTVYVVRSDGGAASVRVHAVDLLTGRIKAASAALALPAGIGFRIALDGPRRRVLLLPSCDRCGAAPPLGVLHADTLALAGTFPQAAVADVGPMGPGQSNGVWLHANASNEVYFAWLSRFLAGSPGGGPDPACLHLSLTRVDARTGAALEHADMRRASAAVSGSDRFCGVGQILQLDAPSPPALSADVSGATVTLSWSDPGNATHFDVEVGSASGLRNLLVLSRTGTTFAAADVPPGTYYVRVRAINEIGRSRPSNEVRVVVR
jgi:hypothetical protein